jgi:hypothetical protein
MATIFKTSTAISLALFGTGLITSNSASAKTVVEIKQALAKGGVESDIGATRIIVDGSSSSQYDKVVSKSLDFWVSVSGATPDNADSFRRLKLIAGGKEIDAEKPGTPRIYKISAPYSNPRSETVVNQKISPVDICNTEINKRSGAARAAYLKSGGTILAEDAYGLKAVATWWLVPGGIGFKESYNRDFVSDARANAVIECRALDRPKPRTETHTQGAPSKPGQRLESPVKTVALKAEPFANATIGAQQCPTRIRLYGFVETRRAFAGQLIFMGPYFLTPLEKLDFKAAGTRTLTAEYPVKWGDNAGTKISEPGLKKQSVTLRVNVTNANGKVLESDSQTVQLACKATRVAPSKDANSTIVSQALKDDAAAITTPEDPASGQATGKRAHGPMRARQVYDQSLANNFDVSIRRADRQGPGGATQVWVYNSGPDIAKSCKLEVRENSANAWTSLMLGEIASRGTTKFDGTLPTSPGLEFRVSCPTEPEERRANNRLSLP